VHGLKEIIKTVKTAMLTTRSSDGVLHARAMTPCSPHDKTQLTLNFIGNNASYKFSEIENDSHVNVSFYDQKTTNWASFAGTARIIRDKAIIEEYWSPITAAYFGDLGDGVHKGDVNDPRVSLIEVIPDEVHYWVATEGSIARAVNTTVGAVTGKGRAPGELRTITKAEIQLTQGLHTK